MILWTMQYCIVHSCIFDLRYQGYLDAGVLLCCDVDVPLFVEEAGFAGDGTVIAIAVVATNEPNTNPIKHTFFTLIMISLYLN